MDSTWLSHGARLESYVFLAVLFLFAILETLVPYRVPKLSTPLRWLNHGVLLAIGTAVNILLFRGGAVVFAVFVNAKGWGVTTRFPYPLRFAIAVLALDLLHYTSHYIYHRIPFLWRIHRVHHTDVDYDVTTGFRFHPLESALTQLIGFALIAALGLPALAVLAAELLTLFQDIFEHANIQIPPSVDRPLNFLLISPSVHRIHHSALAADHDRNYGTIFPWWDRLFGTYRQDSSMPQDKMDLGLTGYPETHSASIVHTLISPIE